VLGYLELELGLVKGRVQYTLFRVHLLRNIDKPRAHISLSIFLPTDRFINFVTYGNLSNGKTKLSYLY